MSHLLHEKRFQTDRHAERKEGKERNIEAERSQILKKQTEIRTNGRIYIDIIFFHLSLFLSLFVLVMVSMSLLVVSSTVFLRMYSCTRAYALACVWADRQKICKESELISYLLKWATCGDTETKPEMRETLLLPPDANIRFSFDWENKTTGQVVMFVLLTTEQKCSRFRRTNDSYRTNTHRILQSENSYISILAENVGMDK